LGRFITSRLRLYYDNLQNSQDLRNYSVLVQKKLNNHDRPVSNVDWLLEHDISMKMTTIEDFRIRYLEYSDVPKASDSTQVLLLLHGIGASADRWLPVVPGLSRYFRVIVPDIIGFGYSDKPTVEYTVDFFIAFLQSFLDNLNIQNATIVGSSFGGWMAMEFAIRFSRRVDKLILAAPAGLMQFSTHVLDEYIMAALYPTRENTLKAFMDMAFDPRIVTEDTVTDFVNRMRLPNAKYAFMSTLLGIRDSQTLHERLPKILMPTLFVWGKDDNMIPMECLKDYRQVPQAKLVVINDCGHTPFVEKPAEFNKAILEFLVSSTHKDQVK
jgi:pimeloyl-ACP methyl ester carboxylesterase